MKKKTIALTASAAALIVALVAWWLWPTRYDAIVPAEAKAVLRIDGTRMKDASQGAEQLKNLLGIVPDGLDLSRPAYAFITPNEYVGIVLAMADGDAFNGTVGRLVQQKKTMRLDDSDGLHWTWMNDGWLMAWDGRMLVALGPGVAQERDNLRQTIARMKRADHRFIDTDAYTHLTAQNGSLQLYATLDAVPAPYNALFRLTVPADCPQEAVQLFASADWPTGSNALTMNYTLESDNAEVRSAIDAYEKGKSGIGFNRMQQTPLFCMCTSMKGQDLLALIHSDATMRGLLMGLNSVADADRMLGTLDGLLELRIDSLGADWTPAFCLTAENATKGLTADSDYWLECAAKQRDVTLRRLTPDTYLLANGKQTLTFGVCTPKGGRQRVFFASPSMAALAAAPSGFTKATPTVDGPLAYFCIDMALLRRQPCMKNGAVKALVERLMPASHSLVYRAFAGRKGTLVMH